MNWSALSLIAIISLHYGSCQIERALTESKQHDNLRSSNAYWQSWLSPEGVVWYPGHVDYRKNEKTNGESVEPDDLDGSYPTTRRYYTIEKGPQFLSEYKQQNAAQTGLQKSDERQYVFPHYGYGTGGEYQRGGNQQKPKFRQNQQLPILNQDPSGQIHYGEYFLNGQRVPKHPGSNRQAHFGHIDHVGRDKFTPNYDGDIRYVPGYPSRLNQGSQYETNHNGRFIQSQSPPKPNGAALVEEKEHYDLPDHHYPNSQLPTYETENDYHGSRFQVPPGEGYLPYGQDYFFENGQQHNSKDVESAIQETPYDQYPSGTQKLVDTRPDNFYGQHVILAGRDGLPAPNKDANRSIMEGRRKASPIEVIGNRTDENIFQPDKNLKPYKPYHGKEENRRELEETEESHVIGTTASKTSSLPDYTFVRKEAQTNGPSYERNERHESLSKQQQIDVMKRANISSPTQQISISQDKYPNTRYIKSEYRDNNKNKKYVVKETLVTVPTVEIKFNMFQPDVSNKEEKFKMISQRQHIRNETRDHKRRIGGHTSRLNYNGQQNLHRHRNMQAISQPVYSTANNTNRHDTPKLKRQQSNFKSPSIQQKARPSLRKEESTSVQQVIGDRAAAVDLGMTNNNLNSKSGIHINQHYDHINRQHLTEDNHQLLSNPNLFVDTYDRYAPFEHPSENGAVKDWKQIRRKQHIPHRSFEIRREHNSRRKQNNNREPIKSVPGIAQRNACPSVSQCRCCRWSTQQTEKAVKCLQPKYKRVEVQVCIEENNGVCVRTGKKQTLKPNGAEIKMCSRVQLKRSCHVCCPSHYPVGNKTTCIGILDGINKTGLRISISADEGQIEYARLPKNYQPRQRHNTQRNGRDRSNNGARTRHQSRRRTVRRPRSVAV